VNAPSLSPEVLQVLRPYLTLGEKLGSLVAQLAPEAVSELTIEVSGEVAEREIKACTSAVLRGLLGRHLESGVNYVNAPAIARERGLRVVESQVRDRSDHQNSITVRVSGSGGTAVAQGAVYDADTVRLTKVNDFRMEAVPEGHVLMLNNRDVPGVVGRVATLLGENRINIAGLELGRERVGGQAISFFHVDDPVPDAVLERLRTLPEIVSAQVLEL